MQECPRALKFLTGNAGITDACVGQLVVVRVRVRVVALGWSVLR